VAFFVYVIESLTTGGRYIGQTGDLNRRLAEHNDPEHKPAKYTSRQAGPWKLIYQEIHPTCSQAVRRERWLKSRTGRRWLNAELGRASPAAEG